jgi:hypothetical protein
MVNGLSPEQIIIGATIATDTVYDFGEAVRTGDNFRDAAFGVGGNLAGSVVGLNMGTRYLDRRPMMARSKYSGVVPVMTSLAGNVVGGYLGDRVNDVVKVVGI